MTMRMDQTILPTLERVLRGLRRRLRGFYYSRVLKSMGTGCQICDGALITRHENVSLGDGKSGLLVQPQDERELAAAIKTLIANESLRNKFVDSGLELAQNSTPDVQARKVEETLRESVPAIRDVPTYLAEDGNRSCANTNCQ